MMTSIDGLYAFGEVNFAYHGATRLGANALLSCIFDGLFCGMSVVNYVRDVPADRHASALPPGAYDAATQRERERMDSLIGTVPQGGPSLDPDTNPYVIAREMGDEMNAACTVVKTGPRLEKTLAKLHELRDRYARVRLADNAMWTNQTLSFTRALGDMLVLAELITKASLLREESRGSHFRLDFPDRDDGRFLKASYAEFDAASGAHRISWRDVDTSLVKPRPRTYGKVEKADTKDAPPEASRTAQVATTETQS
jgi:succinate dehydrogenase / fumarate reductase flavoprotein subunit